MCQALNLLTHHAVQAILMNLVVHYNPACMKQLFLASNQSLSEGQMSEKYDAVVVSCWAWAALFSSGWHAGMGMSWAWLTTLERQDFMAASCCILDSCLLVG